jgi:hypothetical protein
MKQPFFIFLAVFACAMSIPAQIPRNNCPKIAVIGPSGVTRAGETLTFTANVGASDRNSKLEYSWTVSAGTIESGQGTSSIKVRSMQEMGNTTITATLKVIGLAADCSSTAYEEAGIYAIIDYEVVDQFGKLSKNYVKLRIDNLYIRLNNSPDSEGIITVRFNNKESRAYKIAHLNALYDAIILLKYDPARVSFEIMEYDRETSTIFNIIPSDSSMATRGIYTSKLIKGENLKAKMKTMFPRK